MKIVFLCTSLAPGRDGVGDYARLLAEACNAAGHVCLLIAVHDRNLAPDSTFIQEGNEIRLSASLTWEKRCSLLKTALREFDPHWVSWQIVPYGFHAKGIMPKQAFSLIEATSSWPNHVMLHELWLGLARSDGLRPRLIGALQRRRLLGFLRRLRPLAVHTTNEAYQLSLARCGWLAEVLPLFGNMPISAVDNAGAQSVLADLAGASLPPLPRTVGIIFGTIHPQWNPTETMKWLGAAAKSSRRPVTLVAIGRAGQHGTRLLTRLSSEQKEITIISLGAQSPERISEVLQAADFGIATHPWALLEKSGTTVSMLEHGLPVLVPRDDWESRDGTLTAARDPLLRRMSDFPPAEFSAWLRLRRPPAAQLPTLAASFVNQLSEPAVRGALVA